MSDAVRELQQAVVAALYAHPVLSAMLSGVFDGPPPRAPFPYISIADGLVTDWSTKTETGREIRMALTVWDDGEMPARLHELMGHVEDVIAALPGTVGNWRIASNMFLRSLIARDPAGPWAGLVEQRIRLLNQ